MDIFSLYLLLTASPRFLAAFLLAGLTVIAFLLRYAPRAPLRNKMPWLPIAPLLCYLAIATLCARFGYGLEMIIMLDAVINVCWLAMLIGPPLGLGIWAYRRWIAEPEATVKAPPLRRDFKPRVVSDRTKKSA